jgi:mannitol-1-phosphate/altronate dehydrogenase
VSPYISPHPSNSVSLTRDFLSVSLSEKRAIHFGAGNIGRGFIGALLTQPSHHVVLAHVDKQLIDNNKEHRQYDVHILEGKIPLRTDIKNITDFTTTTHSITTRLWILRWSLSPRPSALAYSPRSQGS